MTLSCRAVGGFGHKHRREQHHHHRHHVRGGLLPTAGVVVQRSQVLTDPEARVVRSDCPPLRPDCRYRSRGLSVDLLRSMMFKV